MVGNINDKVEKEAYKVNEKELIRSNERLSKKNNKNKSLIKKQKKMVRPKKKIVLIDLSSPEFASELQSPQSSLSKIYKTKQEIKSADKTKCNSQYKTHDQKKKAE